jgi:hypothetical protein
VRWSLAAAAIFGGLGILALAFFFLLALAGIIEFAGGSVALYWLVALPFILFFGAWLLLVVWCYVDAERRRMNAPLWAILVLVLGFPVGPLVYLLLRPAEPGG